MTFNPNGRAVAILAVQTALSAAAFAVVCLRLFVRRRVSRFFGADDYWIIGAVACNLIYLGIVVYSIVNGDGDHISTISKAKIKPLLKSIWLLQVARPWSICLVKISILSFYLRIFKASQKLRYATIFFIGLVCATGLALDLAFVFQCSPISNVWTPAEELGHAPNCVNRTALRLSAGLISPLTDLGIMLLPLPTFLRLHVSRRAKIGVVLTFLFGSLAVIASFVRFVKLIDYSKSKDPSWDALTVSIWTSLEVSIAIITASAPALKVLFSKWFEEPVDKPSSRRNANPNGNLSFIKLDSPTTDGFRSTDQSKAAPLPTLRQIEDDPHKIEDGEVLVGSIIT